MKTVLSFIFLLAMGAEAHALTALGCAQITPTSATLLSSVTGGIPNQTTLVSIAVEGQSVRYRDDGVAPTASVGMLLPVGGPWPYTATFPALQFIQTASAATVDVCFYR